MRNRGCYKHVAISSLLSKLVPVFSSHVECARFAESRPFYQVWQEQARRLRTGRGSTPVFEQALQGPGLWGGDY